MKVFLRVYSGACHLMGGILVGLGFVAAYAKFKATKPGLIELLDVGRQQFSALHTIEWIAIPVLVLVGMIVGGKSRLISMVAAITFVVQMALIFPPLDDRMVRAIAGESLPASNLHFYYVANALLLLFALIGMGICSSSVSEVGQADAPTLEN